MKHEQLEDEVKKGGKETFAVIMKGASGIELIDGLKNALIEEHQENKTKIKFEDMEKKGDWVATPPEYSNKDMKNFKKFAKENDVQFATKTLKGSKPPVQALIVRGEPDKIQKAIGDFEKDIARREKMPPIKERLNNAFEEVAKVKDLILDKEKSKGRDDGR